VESGGGGYGDRYILDPLREEICTVMQRHQISLIDRGLDEYDSEEDL
jgi:hypothetical protein